jgi:hypothetical protein
MEKKITGNDKIAMKCEGNGNIFAKDGGKKGLETGMQQ